jgi:hypothetical protein
MNNQKDETGNTLAQADLIESSRKTGSFQRKLLVGTLMVTSVLAMPTESHADIFSVFGAIFSLISGPIGGALSSINSITSDMQQLYQQTVYPLALINQARGFVSNSINSYRGYMNGVFQTPFRSATLSGPQQFETILHSRDSTQLAALGQSYTSNVGAVPVANAANPQDRVMMDVDDTLGQENLKTTMISDQGEDTILAVADSIENQVATAAPGSAPFLTAQAQVANIRSQAFIQKMIAADLRQEAGRIAHDNVLVKRRTQNTGSITNTINTVLTNQQ